MCKKILLESIQGYDFLATYKVERDPRIKIKVTTHTLGIGISPLRAKVMAWSEEYPILRMVLT